MMIEKVCRPCDLTQPPDAIACERCGGPVNRKLDVTVTDDLPKLHESLKIKQKRPGVKKPLVEHLQGADFHRDSGTWRDRLHRIDRTVKPDRRTELIIGEDGTIYKDIDVRLDDQTTHGEQPVRHEWKPEPPDGKV
jgi:hypothetical protein